MLRYLARRTGYAAVLLLAIDPAAFGGREEYRRQVDRLVEACRASAPRPGFDRVALPGEAAQQRRRQRLRDGVPVAAELMADLAARAARAGIAVPAGRAGPA